MNAREEAEMPARRLWAPLILLAGFWFACGGTAGSPEATTREDADPSTELVNDANDTPGMSDVGDGAAPDLPVGDLPDSECIRNCQDSVWYCGPDGCGGTCGPCIDGLVCMENSCVFVEVPNCDGRECGPDGYDGECPPGCSATQECSLQGKCVPHCDWSTEKPTTWGPGGLVMEARCPAELEAIHATCFDFTGDGKGDNGIRSQCRQVVPDPGGEEPKPMAFVLELEGTQPLADTGLFVLNVLPVVLPEDGMTTYDDLLVTMGAYDHRSCLAHARFGDAKIEAGVLTAGPASIWVETAAFAGRSIRFRLVDARVRGAIVPGGDLNGYELADGVFTAVLTQQAFEAGVYELQVVCDTTTPTPEWCQYMPTLQAVMNLADLHQNGDGTYSGRSADLSADALSLCWTFRLVKAKIVGLQDL